MSSKYSKYFIVAIMLSIVFSCSVYASATEEAMPIQDSEIVSSGLQINNIVNSSDSIRLEKGEIKQVAMPEIQLESNLVEEIAIDSTPAETTPFAANRPPVAGLQYVILNPETLVNGKLTTETQIAWLWSYNGEDFTYDPDGDEIIDRFVDGISSSDIVGLLEGNIGFVTQFKVAAQYVMYYQVVDEHGAYSDVLDVTISIEPTDGHTRPTVSLGANTTSPHANELMYLTCAGSVDYMGNPTVGFNGWVFDEDGKKSLLLDYIVVIDGELQFDSTSAFIKFPKMGTYEIWISVKDSLGAWSDWSIFNLVVRDGTIELYDMYISTSDGIPVDPIPSHLDHVWVDYRQSITMAQYEPDPYVIWNAVTSKDAPSALTGRKHIGYGFTVSGYVKYTDGTPKVETLVDIQLPLINGKEFHKQVETDKNGYFEMSTDMSDYFMTVMNLPIDVYRVDAGYRSNYGFFGTLGINMLFVTPSQIRVYSNGAEYTESVIATTGHCWNARLGDKWFMKKQGNLKVWEELQYPGA